MTMTVIVTIFKPAGLKVPEKKVETIHAAANTVPRNQTSPFVIEDAGQK